MPSVKENQTKWNQTYDWQDQGNEWSERWGTASMQWLVTILPRIQRFLPAGSVLEIAPGFGRWTQFLKDHCEELTIVDLSEKCISACRARFKDSNNISYHVNDGKSLDMIPDNSLDFVFSFDSLVHADEDALETYIQHLSMKMQQDAVAFIHHSNMGNCQSWLNQDNFNHGWRCLTMTYQKFETYSQQAGLICLGQELVNWGDRPRDCLIDCFSLITRPGSKWARKNQIIQNKDFMKESDMARTISGQYELI